MAHLVATGAFEVDSKRHNTLLLSTLAKGAGAARSPHLLSLRSHVVQGEHDPCRCRTPERCCWRGLPSRMGDVLKS